MILKLKNWAKYRHEEHSVDTKKRYATATKMATMAILSLLLFDDDVVIVIWLQRQSTVVMVILPEEIFAVESKLEEDWTIKLNPSTSIFRINDLHIISFDMLKYINSVP